MMTDKKQNADGAILLLGASGKLGRMVLHHAAAAVLPIGRSGPGIRWCPGSPPPPVPPVRAILALWGSPVRPSEHPGLAVAAMELGMQTGARLVVHCSSAAVYGPRVGPIAETDRPDPLTPYGRGKRDMERAIAEFRAAHPRGPRAVTLRIGNVAGADSLFEGMRAAEGVTLDRFGDGRGPRRGYLSPEDLATALLRIVRDDAMDGVYNLAAAGTTAMGDIAALAGVPVSWREAPPEAIAEVSLDCRRLCDALPGFAPTADPAALLQAARDCGAWP